MYKFTKQVDLKNMNKDWLIRSSMLNDTSTHRMLFQWARIISNPTKRVGLVQSEHLNDM
jgi:hypothetical protein